MRGRVALLENYREEQGCRRGMDVAWQERDAAVRAAIVGNGYFVGEAASLPLELSSTDLRRVSTPETRQDRRQHTWPSRAKFVV